MRSPLLLVPAVVAAMSVMADATSAAEDRHRAVVRRKGEPVSVEVFTGNTADPQTFGDQVKKVAERFGCRRVTFIGDRGMIKSAQVEELESVDFHYITAITKAQIRSLIKKGVFQLELFDRQLCEIQDEGVRYVLRRNTLRAKEMDPRLAGFEARRPATDSRCTKPLSLRAPTRRRLCGLEESLGERKLFGVKFDRNCDRRRTTHSRRG